MTILGIDIGMKGALAFYTQDGLKVYDMPIYAVKKGNALDLKALSTMIKDHLPIQHAYIESAQLMPSNGKTSFQKLGIAQGAMQMAMACLDIPYTMVAPRTWKKDMKCPKDKDGARMRASELMPSHAHNWPLKKHDGRAEAALIALYGDGIVN